MSVTTFHRSGAANDGDGGSSAPAPQVVPLSSSKDEEEEDDSARSSVEAVTMDSDRTCVSIDTSASIARAFGISAARVGE